MGGAGAAALAGLRPDQAATEPPPETTRLRIVRGPSPCATPNFVAEKLLRGEGFTDLHYVPRERKGSLCFLLRAGGTATTKQMAAAILSAYQSH